MKKSIRLLIGFAFIGAAAIAAYNVPHPPVKLSPPEQLYVASGYDNYTTQEMEHAKGLADVVASDLQCESARPAVAKGITEHTEKFFSGVRKEAIAAIGRNLDEQQIKDSIAFYDTDAGQKFSVIFWKSMSDTDDADAFAAQFSEQMQESLTDEEKKQYKEYSRTLFEPFRKAHKEVIAYRDGAGDTLKKAVQEISDQYVDSDGKCK